MGLSAETGLFAGTRLRRLRRIGTMDRLATSKGQQASALEGELADGLTWTDFGVPLILRASLNNGSE